MAFKVVFLCASALFVQTAFGQYISGNSGLGLVNAGSIGSSIGIAAPALKPKAIGLSGLNIVSSGPLPVTAISPIGPSGLAVASENVIEGNLAVSGSLPFLSAVAFEGTLPTAGSGVATCGCGSGQVGIVTEGFGQPSLGLGSVGLGGLGNLGGLSGLGGLGNVGSVGFGIGNAGLGGLYY